MQVNNNISFTSVIPVKVIANGIETTDQATVRKTCNMLCRALAGPIKHNKNTAVRNGAARLSTMDPDYNYYLAYSKGYVDHLGGATSHYFRTISDKKGKGYIVTGKELEYFKHCGHEIGSARKECNSLGTDMTNRLKMAYDQYYNMLNRVGNDVELRLKELFNPFSRKREGKFQELVVNVTTKNIKQKGVPSIAVKSIDHIDYIDRI